MAECAQTCLAVVRPNGEAAYIGCFVSNNILWLEGIAKQFFGENAWREMGEAGYRLQVMTLTATQDGRFIDRRQEPKPLTPDLPKATDGG